MKFSVIMPLYNMEKYVNQAIDSVIRQSLGIENIQLIIINDGSTDSTEDICYTYINRYPDNITYLKKENGGVSSARNMGLDNVQGDFVCFLDGDDIWESNAFQTAYDFFCQHEEIDMICCRVIKYPVLPNQAHALDFRFDSDKVVDLTEKPFYTQSTIGNSIFRVAVIKNLHFDAKLQVSEDALFNAAVFLKNRKIGILKSAEYYYRKHPTGISLSGRNFESKHWYLGVPKFFSLFLLDRTEKICGNIPQFIQCILLYDLRWRILYRRMDKLLTIQEQQDYTKMLCQILQHIDDEIITKSLGLQRVYKLFLLRMKYNYDILQNTIINKKGMIRYNNVSIFNAKGFGRCNINIIEIKENMLILKGTSDVSTVEGLLQLFAVDNNEKIYPVQLERYRLGDIKAYTGEIMREGQCFTLHVPLRIGLKLRFFTKFRSNEQRYYVNISFGKFARLIAKSNLEYNSTYFYSGKYLLSFSQKNGIRVQKNSVKNRISCEKKYADELLKNGREDLVNLRKDYFKTVNNKSKPVWIISDRIYKAGDNGEALFKYIMSTEVGKTHDVYFVFCSKEKEEYERLQKIGKVINHDSEEYRLLFLQADKIISSHADETVINPFFEDREYLKNLYHFDFIYLQHGILPGDLAKWLNIFNKNIKLMFTSSEREKNSIISGDYGYTNREIKLTGAPRLDEIQDTPKRIIAFLPTWRKNLTGEKTADGRDYIYNPEFVKSDYWKYYNNLINDERILNVMKIHNFSGEFFIHPSLRQQAVDFKGNDIIHVGKTTADYNRLISESNMAITDYSSVIFDFAYLRKTIIYTQFDSKTYWENHTYDKGYFDYEKNGFGAVYYDYESTVCGIVEAIKNDCTNSKKYVERCNAFFDFDDRNNAKRVLNEIVQTEKNCSLFSKLFSLRQKEGNAD